MALAMETCQAGGRVWCAWAGAPARGGGARAVSNAAARGARTRHLRPAAAAGGERGEPEQRAAAVLRQPPRQQPARAREGNEGVSGSAASFSSLEATIEETGAPTAFDCLQAGRGIAPPVLLPPEARPSAVRVDGGAAMEGLIDAVLPEHQPGSFPSTKAHPADFLDTISEVGEGDFDPLRDGPLRYCGYANEVGEAFAAWLPVGGVPLSYAVAICYVLVDTYDKATKAYKNATLQLEFKKSAMPEDLNIGRLALALAAERGIDTVVWQMLASVAIPGFTIHQIVALTHQVLDPICENIDAALMAQVSALSTPLGLSSSALIGAVDNSIPTLMGLAVIPLIVHPIDEGVHRLLDAVLRPAMTHFICHNMGGCAAGLDVCDDESCGPFDDTVDEVQEKVQETVSTAASRLPTVIGAASLPVAAVLWFSFMHSHMGSVM